jgi:hypothetical protein
MPASKASAWQFAFASSIILVDHIHSPGDADKSGDEPWVPS